MTEEDVDAEMNRMAELYKMEVDKVKEIFGESQLEEMKKDLAIQKAVKVLSENAVEA